MNDQPTSAPATPPLSAAELVIAKQFLTESQMLRQMATDPETAIAAANWEIRLTQMVTTAAAA